MMNISSHNDALLAQHTRRLDFLKSEVNLPAGILQKLKDFREELTNFSAPENVGGWSLSNLPTHFWETIGECINDIEEHIKIEGYEKKC
jgi:GH18 family chitinase